MVRSAAPQEAYNQNRTDESRHRPGPWWGRVGDQWHTSGTPVASANKSAPNENVDLLNLTRELTMQLVVLRLVRIVESE